MESKNTTLDNSHSISTKVKVYYTFRGSKFTRLATFQMQHDHDTTTLLASIPLKSCLWAVCSSSPDMICGEHDLSVYSANFQESGTSAQYVDQANNLIWEGHGLMSWVMEDQHSSEIYVNGKHNQDHFDVCLELQPTMKWCKTEFYNALQSQDFDGFKLSSLPHTCNCGIYAAICAQQHQQNSDNGMCQYLKRKRLDSSSTSLSDTTSPTLPPISAATQSTNSSASKTTSSPSPPCLPPPSGLMSSSSLSPPSSSLFRPEPIMPSAESYYRRSLPPQGLAPLMDDRHNHYHQQQPPPLPSSMIQTPHHNHLHSESASRSAFTPTITHSGYPSPSAADIPVIYTPSNKKRKKYPPMIMPADNNKKSSTQSQPKNQQRQNSQQVSTAVRTYYEVDRDDGGNYILPVEIDSWTVVDLGTVVYDRPAYHNQRYVYPVNYTVRKWYRSMVDAKSDTQYTCRILDNGREPKFEVTADDCPMTYSGPTPTTVWTIIVRRAFAIRNQEYGHNPVGPDFFGLRKNTIAKMIQDLPNVDKCSQYVWQTFEPARFNKPGRNRRRLDTMISGSILGGVNYSLTSGRLNTVASHQQHQLQIQQRRLSSAMGVTGTIEASTGVIASAVGVSSSSPLSSSASSHDESPSPTAATPPSLPSTTNVTKNHHPPQYHHPYHHHHHHHHHDAPTGNSAQTTAVVPSPSYIRSSPYHTPIETA
ncbi:unnamed protein product [Absidia cylindrospora]